MNGFEESFDADVGGDDQNDKVVNEALLQCAQANTTVADTTTRTGATNIAVRAAALKRTAPQNAGLRADGGDRCVQANEIEKVMRKLSIIPHETDVTNVLDVINSYLPRYSKIEVIMNQWDTEDLNACADFFIENIYHSEYWDKIIDYGGTSYGIMCRFVYITPSKDVHDWVRHYLNTEIFANLYSEYTIIYL